MRKCARCGIVDETNDHDHHIIPRYLGGNDTGGRDVLCIPCHEEYHKCLNRMIKFISRFGIFPEEVIIKEYYKWWLESK